MCGLRVSVNSSVSIEWSAAFSQEGAQKTKLHHRENLKLLNLSLLMGLMGFDPVASTADVLNNADNCGFRATSVVHHKWSGNRTGCKLTSRDNAR